MPFSNLNPPSRSSINVSEDTRNAKVCTTVGVPVAFTAPQVTANANRATYSIYNLGPSPVLMREGDTVTAALHEAVIPVGFYWYPDPSEPRYLGAISLMGSGGAANCQICEASMV